MTKEETLKAEFAVDTTREEYVRASLLAARRNGLLRGLPAVVLTAAALLLIGLCSLGWFREKYASAFFPLLLCLFGILLLFFFFAALPASIRKQASLNYETYLALMNPVSLQLYADRLITVSSCVTLTDSYARMSECVETPDLFVLIKDSERMLVIPKRCFPKEEEGEITAFLRLVFARHRHLMKNWIF